MTGENGICFGSLNCQCEWNGQEMNDPVGVMTVQHNTKEAAVPRIMAQQSAAKQLS
jgi:hypothetical protein